VNEHPFRGITFQCFRDSLDANLPLLHIFSDTINFDNSNHQPTTKLVFTTMQLKAQSKQMLYCRDVAFFELSLRAWRRNTTDIRRGWLDSAATLRIISQASCGIHNHRITQWAVNILLLRVHVFSCKFGMCATVSLLVSLFTTFLRQRLIPCSQAVDRNISVVKFLIVKGAL
jgi:hypothetical protein